MKERRDLICQEKRVRECVRRKKKKKKGRWVGWKMKKRRASLERWMRFNDLYTP